MLTQSHKQQMLQEMDEAEFRRDVLVPLLKKMGYRNVRERHGTDEYGKDITFLEESRLGRGTHYAVIAKVGPISGGSKGKQNLAVVEAQVAMAFDMPVEDVEARAQYPVNRVIVWTTGKISRNARERILRSRTDSLGPNVDFKDVGATVELLEEYYPGFFAIRDPYVADYYAGAKDAYSRLEELRALGCSAERHRLPVIFVAPTLIDLEVRRSGRGRRGAATGSPGRVHTFDQLLEMCRRSDVLVVGDAGSGKSTLLRRVLLSVIEANELALRRSPVPILVECKKLDLTDESCIETSLEREFLRFSPTQSEHGLQPDLDDGSMIVLLDGLDELRTEARIAQALARVEVFRRAYPKTRVLLTSRMLDIFERPDALLNMRALRIAPLGPSEMAEFVEKWYGAGSPLGTRLASLVSGGLYPRGLPATPLTLALVALLYESGSKELPANLTELFDKYVELALGRWDVSKDLALQFEWKVKQFTLRSLAWGMHHSRRSAITDGELRSTVRRLAAERGLSVDPSLFCAEVVDRSELLFRNEDGRYEFKHRSFQDYLAGLEISGRSDAGDIIVESFLDPWWSQAVFFACGSRPDSPEYVEAILARVEVAPSHHLAFAVNLGQVVQATYLSPKAIKSAAVARVLDMMIQAWDHFCQQYGEVERRLADQRQYIRDVPVHIVFVATYAALAQAAIGSVTLLPALSELALRYASAMPPDLSPRQAAEREWGAFLLAAACARADDIADFAGLCDTKVMRDPAFLVVAQAIAKEVASRSWLSQADRSTAEALARRLTQRLGRRRDHLRALRGAPPTPLPPPEGLDRLGSEPALAK